MTFLTMLTYTLVATVFIGTVLPLTRSVRWWVRAWEFPRLHIAVLALLCIPLVLALPISYEAVVIAGLGVCILYQATRIYPYTRFASSEVDLADDVPAENKIKLLSANVLMENPRKADLIRIVEREDPDVLFLMETDQDWLNAVEPLLDKYPR